MDPTPPAPATPPSPAPTTPAAASKIDRFKELSRRAWAAYLPRLKKHIILRLSVLAAAILLTVIGTLTHRRRRHGKPPAVPISNAAPIASAAAKAALPKPPSAASMPGSAQPSVAKSTAAAGSPAPQAAPAATMKIEQAPAMSQQDLEALRMKTAAEREARRKEMQAKIDKAMDVCAPEIGILCNSAKEDSGSAIRCLRRHSGELLQPCLAALESLRSPSTASSGH